MTAVEAAGRPVRRTRAPAGRGALAGLGALVMLMAGAGLGGCAGPAAAQSAAGGDGRIEVRATLSAGPCGAPRADAAPCIVPAEPAAGVPFAVRDVSSGSRVATVTAGPDGRFAATVRAGRYAIELARESMTLRLTPVEVEVAAGAVRVLDVTVEALRP